jgi:lipopolysaccharide/colanic/teichoic acid biosynthesis glycosyltransferase
MHTPMSIGAGGSIHICSGTEHTITLSNLLFWKRAFDLIVACTLLVLALPIIAVSAALVSVDGGSPFYMQTRLGYGGRRFNLIKLRTMCRNADARLEEICEFDAGRREEFARTGRFAQDPRISRIGGFLRRHSVDELPQLINVIRGEMSIVGPRPRTSRWLSQERANTSLFAAYYSVRPGITGLWQTTSRQESDDFARMLLDARYVSRISLYIDISIILRTIPLLVRAR